MQFSRIIPLLFFVLPVTAQVTLTLKEAGSRVGPDYRPAHLGQEIVVRGVVPMRAIPVVDYSLLPIEDEAGYGLALAGKIGDFESIAKGDLIEARGKVGARAGLPVLYPSAIKTITQREPYPAKHVSIRELNDFRYLCTRVTTEGPVLKVGANSGGYFLDIGDEDRPVTVFLPFLSNPQGDHFPDFRRGDLVRVTGMASQYSPLPPYNRYYQILLRNPGMVQLLERSWPIPTWATLTTLGVFCLLLVVWSLRERHMSAKRRSLRSLYRIGEEIVAAHSTQESLRILQSALPLAIGSLTAMVYVYDHGTKTLRRVEDDDPFTAAGSGSPPEAAMSCWRNRSLLVIPDIQQSPFYATERSSRQSRTAMFVPMFAQSDMVGVLENEGALTKKHFDEDVQAVAQHLANQIAIGIELRERQLVREQLFQNNRPAPAVEPKTAPAAMAEDVLLHEARPITSLVVEPNEENRRALVAALGQRGHRAVPAASGEEASDLTSRFHFQALFCSTKLPGIDCIALLERIRTRVNAFVFLREGVDGEGTLALPHGEGYVLTSPVASDELDRVLLSIQSGLVKKPE
ncbi:MAG: GAF domain-containing protein [Bryobacteraceae bacterium]